MSGADTPDEAVSTEGSATPAGDAAETRPTAPEPADAPAEADASADADEAPVARRHPNRRWLVLGIVGVLILALVAIAAVVGRYLFAVQSALGKMNHDSLLPTSSVTVPTASGQAGHPAPVTFLLIGSDSRDLKVERGRSDSLMVGQISGDRKSVTLVSIPRDSWVPIPGHDDAKINAAYSWGGAPLAVETVQNLLQVKIDHVVITNFDSFTSVIDTLGGVDVWNSNPGTFGGQTFPGGQLHLDGASALKYTRERYDLPNGDLDRAARQRDVLKAIIEKLVSRGTLADPNKFSAALDQIAPLITVDDQLTTSEMQKLGLSIGSATTSPAIQLLQAPITGFGKSADGQDYDQPDFAGLKALGDALRTDQMSDYYKQHRNDPPIKK